jgi:ribosome-associated toxin RatA of RatAB toxin-antitoxin module
MTDQATEEMEVGAPPERCWEVVVDFERYPEWASRIKQVIVEDNDEEGRPSRVTYRAGAMGRSTQYTLRYDYSDGPRQLSWVLEKGDVMRKLDGSYIFDAVDDDRTAVTYHLEAELVLPLPSFIKGRARSFILHTALRELKARVER